MKVRADREAAQEAERVKSVALEAAKQQGHATGLQQGLDEAAALEKGMEVKSVEFVKAGAEVYSKV